MTLLRDQKDHMKFGHITIPVILHGDWQVFLPKKQREKVNGGTRMTKDEEYLARLWCEINGGSTITQAQLDAIANVAASLGYEVHRKEEDI
jgi:hypothetical protein